MYYKMDELWYHVKWMKLDTKWHIATILFIWSILNIQRYSISVNIKYRLVSNTFLLAWTSGGQYMPVVWLILLVVWTNLLAFTGLFTNRINKKLPNGIVMHVSPVVQVSENVTFSNHSCPTAKPKLWPSHECVKETKNQLFNGVFF